VLMPLHESSSATRRTREAMVLLAAMTRTY
jgi:hypothetical protein